MQLKFQDASLHGIGAQSNRPGTQWATLTLRLLDTDSGHWRPVELELLVPKRPDATISELQEAARTEAKAILAECLRLLEESTIAELEAEGLRLFDEGLGSELPQP